MGRLKGFIVSHLRVGLSALAYRGILPRPWSGWILAVYWECLADDIHTRWGSGADDYQILSSMLERYQPQTLLDAGCGSGRLFKLYQERGILEVTGTDVSSHALKLARLASSRFKLRQLSLAELDYPHQAFDLGICNRVLQHIPAYDISSVVQKLCYTCRLVYVNEITNSDDLEETFWMRKHDYPRLFSKHCFTCLETGRIGKQTYYLFGHSDDSCPNGDLSR